MDLWSAASFSSKYKVGPELDEPLNSYVAETSTPNAQIIAPSKPKSPTGWFSKLFTFAAPLPNSIPSQNSSVAVRHDEIADQQVRPFSDSGPATGISLRLKRAERLGTFGSIVFTLDARIDVSAENRALIIKYKLGNRLIYESANREKYAARARQHAENTRDQPSIFAPPGAQAWGVAKTIGRLGAAAFNATASALSLRITVNSLIEGVHVECKEMEEILEAEEAIKDAALNLKAYLDSAITFSGQEQIIDL